MYIIITCILVILLFCCLLNRLKLDQQFYEQKEIYPELGELQDNWEVVRKEAMDAQNGWKDWPEDLVNKEGRWTVFPLLGFGKWVPENCEKCPETTRMLRKINGLRTAGFSRLGKNTKLRFHRGWASLSNHVLRCHLPLIVPKKGKCGIAVDNKFQQHVAGKWMVFDDSKVHSGINETDEERIILLVDLERPFCVAKGTSPSEDTSELKQFVAAM